MRESVGLQEFAQVHFCITEIMVVSLNYAYAKLEFWAIFRHTALLVTLGNQALLGEVTVEPDSESQLLP